MNNYYIYEFYNTDNQEVFYVGKGIGKRYKNLRKRNRLFNSYILSHNYNSRIVLSNLTDTEAEIEEKKLIKLHLENGSPLCNMKVSGTGGDTFNRLSVESKERFKEKIKKSHEKRWTSEELRRKHSENVRKGMQSEGVSEKIRERTKAFMWKPKTRQLLLYNNAKMVYIKDNENILFFETISKANEYLKVKYGLSKKFTDCVARGESPVVVGWKYETKILKQILNLELKIVSYKESVTTNHDECSDVKWIKPHLKCVAKTKKS